MTNRIVPVVIGSTGEVVGTANVSPPDENGKVNASINITNQELLRQHKGLIKILLEEETRTHDAFLNSYSEEDEGLYE